MDAIIYGTSKCVWCDNVAKDLKNADIDITKVDVTDAQNLAEMKKIAGENARTVPQVVIDGKYIGGYTEVDRYLRSLKPVEEIPQVHRG